VVDGGSLYPGDVVETAAGSRGVIAFRDDSRITLGPSTRFRIDNFVYDEQNAGEGRFLVSLLRGSVRALTGLIDKSNNRNVAFSTATATIGIRGTGFDMACAGDCAAGNLTLYTWLGAISYQQTGQTALELLQAGQGLLVTPTGLTPINNQPDVDGPRPDGVVVPAKLFAKEEVSDAKEGLFVFVRDGHIEVATATEVLHLGKGEAGFAAPEGGTARPFTIPKFIDFDRLPMPTARNPLLLTVLADNAIRPANTCK
jgi:ferric-dicitrate binding protein FerR (iron transport regulator)